MVERVQANACGGAPRPASPEEEPVEVGVQREQCERRSGRRTPSARGERSDEGEHRERAQAVPPPEIERRGRDSALEEELEPRNAAAREVRVEHVYERPCLQVLTLEAWVETDAAARLGEAETEVDVLDRRVRIPSRVEASDRGKNLAPDRAETCPERGGRARSAVVDVVVQEIPKRRHHSRVLGVVVVGAEERGELGLGVEGSADALEGIRMDDDIGVDEHEDLAGRPRSALVASRGRTGRGRHRDDDHLLGRLLRGADRGHATVEARRLVRGGDDGRESGHRR